MYKSLFYCLLTILIYSVVGIHLLILVSNEWKENQK